MRFSILVVSLLFLIFNLVNAKEPHKVSIYKLLVQGENYHNQEVLFYGRLDLSHKEDFAVYPDNSSYEHHLLSNGIRLRLTKEEYEQWVNLHGAFVIAIGLYRHKENYGELTEVSFVYNQKRQDLEE